MKDLLQAGDSGKPVIEFKSLRVIELMMMESPAQVWRPENQEGWGQEKMMSQLCSQADKFNLPLHFSSL